MRYLQIWVKGYKSLADVTLNLHPLTVMIGPNGCGKTSLLEVFGLLKQAARKHLAEMINGMGGLGVLLSHVKEVPYGIEIGIRAKSSLNETNSSFAYSFVLLPQVITYKVARERLEQILPSGELQGEPLELTSSTVQELDLLFHLLPGAETLSDGLEKALLLGPLSIDFRAPIRFPQALIPTHLPGINGETLFAALYNLRESKEFRSYYERIEETLHLAFPDFERLELPVVGAGQITLAWRQKSLTIPLYPNQLSEGTLRFLWLATALLSPEPSPLILIDEPEVSLHPELLQILSALLRDASARTQLIVATHSSDLIRWLRPDEVVVIDKQDGKSTFTWADDPALDLEKWLQEYTLADLWYMGNLGGRP